MMDREIPYNENAECDLCGHIGAYDFMGDYLCDECIDKLTCPHCGTIGDCDCQKHITKESNND
jgi:hypothetical protein